MAKFDASLSLKRLNNRYRLVIMNEDTYEEVAKFKLSRWSVYVAACSLFVLLVGLTVALIAFTPLKYYLPGVGYGDVKQVKELKSLKIQTDSVFNAQKKAEKYMTDIKKMLEGNLPRLDTSRLVLPGVDSVKE
jgi:hypothetical protein